MPKSVTKSATITRAFGSDLAEPIKFNYTYDELQNNEKAEVELTEKQKRQWANANAAAKSRAAAQSDALEAAGIKAPDVAETPELQIKGMMKYLLMARKDLDEAQARQIAIANLGFAPESV